MRMYPTIVLQVPFPSLPSLPFPSFPSLPFPSLPFPFLSFLSPLFSLAKNPRVKRRECLSFLPSHCRFFFDPLVNPTATNTVRGMAFAFCDAEIGEKVKGLLHEVYSRHSADKEERSINADSLNNRNACGTQGIVSLVTYIRVDYHKG